MTESEFMEIHLRHRDLCSQFGDSPYLEDIIWQLEQDFGTKKVKEYLKKLQNMGIK